MMRFQVNKILVAAALCLATPVSVFGQSPSDDGSSNYESLPKSESGEVQQVTVFAKIVEFQTTKDLASGLSAYFKQRSVPRPYGRVSSGNGAISAADVTFPTGTNAGITVFIDRLSHAYGDIEMVLQGLVDQNRASIVSRPSIKAVVGDSTPAIIKTVQAIPYEQTVVAGLSTSQITAFRDTGVMLSIKANEVIDDDGDPATTDDIFINLEIEAEVNEEGQRIIVALDDFVGSAGVFSEASNAITAPEFISRQIKTNVWVPHGKVLVLGGLYRNTKNKSLATLPWLTQAEGWLNAAVQRLTRGATPTVPLSPMLGNNNVGEGRRELVFMLKAELWRKHLTVPLLDNTLELEEKKSPREAISGFMDSLSSLPQGIAEGIAGTPGENEVQSSLGGLSE